MKKPRFFLPIEVFQNRAISALIHRTCGVAKDCTGTAAIEFALVLFPLLVIVLGTIQFALIFNNISVLTNAAAAGAVVFSEGRGLPTPYSNTVAQVQSAAQSLAPSLAVLIANLKITTSVSSPASCVAATVQANVCAGDATCLTALNNAYPGGCASVTVSYPCPLILSAVTLQWVGISTSFCPLQSTSTGMVM